MDENPEFEARFIQKCMELPTEDMGIHLLRCLKQITGERNSRYEVSMVIGTWNQLLDTFTAHGLRPSMCGKALLFR